MLPLRVIISYEGNFKEKIHHQTDDIFVTTGKTKQVFLVYRNQTVI